jgi:dTMP kinase
VFISLEGIDGSGKSTQAKLLAQELGGDTVLLREPGGTAVGERIREVLKDPELELDPLAELLLFCAARAQLVSEVIRPALEADRDVICDRFSDSSIAYQGVARGLGVERVEDMCDQATGGLWPDLTIILQIPPELAAKRTGRRTPDRFEGEGMDLQLRVMVAYAALAERHPDRVKVVDANADVDCVRSAVMGELRGVRA